MTANREIQMLLFFIKDKNKKSWFRIIKEFTSLWFSKKRLPLYYISNLLYRKNVTNFRDYLSLEESNEILKWSYSQGENQFELVDNKLYFEDLLDRNDIPTPKTYFYNLKNRFTYKGDDFNIEIKSEFITLLDKVLIEEDVERVFCKPTYGEMGKDIFVLDKNTYRNISDDIVSMVLSNAFIFQELVLQHKALKKINQSSINTLRIITYKNTENQVEILSGFIRIGREGAIIDNAHAGGIIVPFNEASGELCKEGIQLIDNGGGIFNKHPDSEVIFDGYKIPNYNEVQLLVKKAAPLFSFPFLGWDVAITPNGPTIIEVNYDFHILLSDRVSKGLKRIPSFKKIAQQQNIN